MESSPRSPRRSPRLRARSRSQSPEKDGLNQRKRSEPLDSLTIPALPAPSIELEPFAKRIRVLEPIANSSVFVDNISIGPASFKQQIIEVSERFDASMEAETPMGPVPSSSAHTANPAIPNHTASTPVSKYASSEPIRMPSISPVRKYHSMHDRSVEETADFLPAIHEMSHEDVNEAKDSSISMHTESITGSNPQSPVGRQSGSPRVNTYLTSPSHAHLERFPQLPQTPHATRFLSPDLLSSPRSIQEILEPLGPDDSIESITKEHFNSIADWMVDKGFIFAAKSLDSILKEIDLQSLESHEIENPAEKERAILRYKAIVKLIEQGVREEKGLKEIIEHSEVKTFMEKMPHNRTERFKYLQDLRTLQQNLIKDANTRGMEEDITVERECNRAYQDIQRDFAHRRSQWKDLTSREEQLQAQVLDAQALITNKHDFEEQIRETTENINRKLAEVSVLQKKVDLLLAKQNQENKTLLARVTEKRDDDRDFLSRRYAAKLDLLRTLWGISSFKVLPSGEYCVLCPSLKILIQPSNKSMSFELLSKSGLLKYFATLLSPSKTLKANLSIWRKGVKISKLVNNIRRLGINSFGVEDGIFTLRLKATFGSVRIQFRGESILVTLTSSDRQLESEINKESPEEALRKLSQKN